MTPRDLQPSGHHYHCLPQVYSIPSPPFASFGYRNQSESRQDSAAPTRTACDRAQHIKVVGCAQQLTSRCSHLTYQPLRWTHCRSPRSSVVMYGSTYRTSHHVLYLFDEVHPRTIQYSPSVHLSLSCAAMRLAQYSILPSSHSLRPCDFDHNCDLAIITTVTLQLQLQLQHCDYYDFIPGHHCDATILCPCDPRTMCVTPNIAIEGHLRPYSHPLLLRHHERPQPLGFTVFIHLSGVGSPIIVLWQKVTKKANTYLVCAICSLFLLL